MTTTRLPASPRYARWRPVGRTLCLVDLENIVGPRCLDQGRLIQAAHRLEALAGTSAGDHVVVATNPAQLMAAPAAFPSARLLVGRGIDGADRALLADWTPERVVAGYDRLVIVSGDHAFEPLATGVRRRARAVHVISRPEALSYRLAKAATRVFVWDEAAAIAA